MLYGCGCFSSPPVDLHGGVLLCYGWYYGCFLVIGARAHPPFGRVATDAYQAWRTAAQPVLGGRGDEHGEDREQLAHEALLDQPADKDAEEDGRRLHPGQKEPGNQRL